MQRCCCSRFLLQLQQFTVLLELVHLELNMLEEYAAVKQRQQQQQQQQAYERCSSRVLLKCRWLLLLLLSARVPVTAWPRRARVRLVLVPLEQSSDSGPVSFFAVQ